MKLNDFIAAFADQFDDTDISEITPDCRFHELDEWSSLTGMGVIAMARSKYGKNLTGKELRDCVTVKDLYNLIESK